MTNIAKLRELFNELLKKHDYQKAVRGHFEGDCIYLDVDIARQLPALLDRLDKLEEAVQRAREMYDLSPSVAYLPLDAALAALDSGE